ncbi:uncharacterized protein LOC143913493 isoform X2 [Arctopsyche grandis]|uniref:uncharacterized protein LOC143913493 isoform X2 n=1 Tax=Arctopsyche grandis TaxID=121162 RepID=UPI00406D966F
MATDLPLEIMNKIFGYLSHRDRLTASRTCSWWHQAIFASTFSVNQHILIHARSNRDRSFHRRLFEIFTRTYNGFPSFTFKNIEIFDIPNLFWKRNSQTIKHLHFYRCKLDLPKFDFYKILRLCSNLESLTFTSCPGLVKLMTELDSDLIEYPPTRPFSIKKLSIHDSTNLSLKLFFRFIANMQVLRELEVSPCILIYSTPRVCPPDDSIRLPHVNAQFQLINNFFKRFIKCNTIEPDFFKILEMPNVRLSSLELNKHVSSVELLKFTLQHCTNLTKLSLANSYTLTDDMLKSVCENFKCLKSLNISNSHVTNVGAFAISSAKCLTHLNISYCNKITSDGIKNGICREVNRTMLQLKVASLRLMPADVVLISERLPNLNLLNMNDCEHSMLNDSVQAVLKNLTNLCTLNMNYCTRVTDDGFIGTDSDGDQVYNLQGLKHLKSLSITYSELTDYSLKNAFNSRRLVYVDLSYCRRISYGGIRVMVVGCPNIETLNLRSCERVRDKCVREIARNLKNLMYLILTGCSSLTNDSISYIKQHCASLKVLDVSRCLKIRTDVAESVYTLPKVHTVLYGGDSFH